MNRTNTLEPSTRPPPYTQMTGADACLSPLHFTEMVDSATDSGVDNENALQQRSNFIDILEVRGGCIVVCEREGRAV